SAAAIDIIKNIVPTESIIKVAPKGLLDTSSGLYLPESPYRDKESPFHQTTNYYKVKSDTYSPSINLEIFSGEAMGFVAKLVIYTGIFVVLWMSFRFKYLVGVGADQKQIDRASRGAAYGFVNAIAWYLLLMPVGDDGISFLFVITITAFFAAIFIIAAFNLLGALALYDYTQPQLTKNITSQIYLIDEVLGSVVVDSAIARITYDAHLENKIQHGLWDGSTDRVNSKFLIGLGDRQKSINDELPESMRVNIDTNCLLSRDWIKNAATRPECRWVIGEQNGINAENSRLSIDWETPIPKLENLEPSARYITHKLLPYIEDAINDYDDWIRASACQAVFGDKVVGSRFNHSLVCAKRTSDGAIIEGEYHGYSSDDGVTYHAVEETVEVIDGRPMLPALENLSLAIREICYQYIDNKSLKLLRENQDQLSKISYRGALDAPNKLTGVFARLNKVHATSKPQAADILYREISPVMSKFVSDNFSAYEREIKQVSEKDYHSYLEYNYPTLAFVWFQNYRYVLLNHAIDNFEKNQSAQNPLYNNIDLFRYYVNASVLGKVSAKIVEHLGYNSKLLNAFSGVMMLFSAICIFAFMFMAVPHQRVMLALMIEVVYKLIIFCIFSLKSQTDTVFEKDDVEEDWFKIDIVRTSVLNTAIKVITLSVVYAIGMAACFIGIVISASLLTFSISMSLDNISVEAVANIILSGIGLLLLISLNIYFTMRKIPFDLYDDSNKLLGDDINATVSRGEGMSQALSATNPKRFFI
ncbi:hypothetical protein, partial [Vibrio hepatarius]|uniref:hypothetical protein n=1 Tax=Vibrio hepatarius TaxID=171383 RepID=UPI001C0932F7